MGNVRSLVILTFLAGMIIMACQQNQETEKMIITAHRGASGWAPENTLAAFKKAMDMGADYSELDVQLSRDEQVVLLHDDTLDRTTTGQGMLGNFTLTELSKFDAGSWYAPQYKGESLPTLENVIQLVRGKMKLNIEIKVAENASGPHIAEKVINVIRSEGFEKECMITSFDRSAVEYIKEVAPELTTGLIFGDKYEGNVFAGSWDVLSANYKVINSDFISNARKAHKKIHVWTVNEKQAMQDLIDMKVDGIITNYPDKLVDVLENKN